MDFFKMVNHFFNRERGVIQNPLAPEQGAAPEVLAPTEVAHPAPDQKERAGLRRGILTSIGKVEQIPLPHILSATENFDEKNFIAGGGFGKVYKGHSEVYGTIAVKRLDHGISGQGQHEFMMEIELLSAYKHGNLVSLVGFCDQDGEKILVYKHESNGSLDTLLRSEDLNWIQRLQICLDAAKGLEYLHQCRVVHRDVKSSNILLDDNMKAKISDFGLSKISPMNVSSTFLISKPCGTVGYIDPEYVVYGVLTQKSDVYSFGVVLFEVLCGRLAGVVQYKDRRQFLCILAPNHFEKHTLYEIIYSSIRDQMDPDSLKTFSTIAYRCLTKYRTDRPSMTEIVEQLQKALDEQLAASSGSGPGAALQQGLSTSMDYMTQSGDIMSFKQDSARLEEEPFKDITKEEFDGLKIPFQDIKQATNNFTDVIARSGATAVYKGQLLWQEKLVSVVITTYGYNKGSRGFSVDSVVALFKQKHENIISLVGFCEEGEGGAMHIVYEFVKYGSLDKYLSSAKLTWLKRLQICLGVAHGLSYVHMPRVNHCIYWGDVHGDIKTANILLDEKWQAKLANLKLSKMGDDRGYHPRYVGGTIGYLDPQYIKAGYLTKESDIYSFGVVLFEVICGRPAFTPNVDKNQFLGPLARQHYEQGTIKKMIDPILITQMDPDSLNTFLAIAYQCLENDRSKRPKITEIIEKLEKALGLQDVF